MTPAYIKNKYKLPSGPTIQIIQQQKTIFIVSPGLQSYLSELKRNHAHVQKDESVT